MLIGKTSALSAVVLIACAMPAAAQHLSAVDRLGCWETEKTFVPRRGNFHTAFCFLKSGRLSGADLHGVSGISIEDKWRRLDRKRVAIGDEVCSLTRSYDGASMQITGCPKFARQWHSADPKAVLIAPQ